MPYSKSFGIIKSIESFCSENMPTIVSFLFISILVSSIQNRSNTTNSSLLLLICHQLLPVVDQNTNTRIADYSTIYWSDLLSIPRNYFLYRNRRVA
jgi:hypothetical protein